MPSIAPEVPRAALVLGYHLFLSQYVMYMDYAGFKKPIPERGVLEVVGAGWLSLPSYAHGRRDASNLLAGLPSAKVPAHWAAKLAICLNYFGQALRRLEPRLFLRNDAHCACFSGCWQAGSERRHFSRIAVLRFGRWRRWRRRVSPSKS